MIIYYIVCVITFSQAQIATLSCSTGYTSQTDCNSSGYCKWYNGACQNQECYLVDEVAACRTQEIYVGALVGVCQQINEFSSDQDNLCMELADTGVQWPFIRWKFNYKGSPTQSITGYSISQLKSSTIQNQQIQQLLTLNINQANKEELNDILDAYLNFNQQLLTVHPHFIEKAIVNAIQKIRDDSTIVTIGASNEKHIMMNKVWIISDIWKQRIRNYKSQYLANYYFILFVQSPLYSQTIGLTTNYQSIKITWNSYNENGFISMIYMRLKVLGVNIGNLSGLFTVDIIQDNGDMLSAPLTVILLYSWTNSYAPASTGQVFLFSYDRVTLAKTKLSTPVTCSAANKNCITNPMTIPSGTSYQFSEDNTDVCSGKTFTYCRLSACTWNGSSCA